MRYEQMMLRYDLKWYYDNYDIALQLWRNIWQILSIAPISKGRHFLLLGGLKFQFRVHSILHQLNTIFKNGRPGILWKKLKKFATYAHDELPV